MKIRIAETQYRLLEEAQRKFKSLTYEEVLNLSDKDLWDLIHFVHADTPNESFEDYKEFHKKYLGPDHLRKRIEKYRNLPDSFQVYRVLMVEPDEIDSNNPGRHYCLKRSSVRSEEFLESIGYYDDDFEFLNVITAEADKQGVAWYETLWSNILYPNDDEITINHVKRVLSIKQLLDF